MKTNPQKFDSILVVDDNESIHNDFRKILCPPKADTTLDELDAEMFGEPLPPAVKPVDFKIHSALQGKDGLKLLISAVNRGLKFGLAFVDMRMPPGWDGVETIEQMWKVDPDLQVVICTAYADKSWEEIFSRLGQTDKLLILKKPFDEIEVVQMATSLCEKRRLLEQSKLHVNDLNQIVNTQKTELIEAHKDAETLIDSMTSLLISLDDVGTVCRWNPVAAELFGIHAAQALGERFDELPVQWCDGAALRQALESCTIAIQKDIEVSFVGKNQKTITLSVNVCPILNDPTSNARLITASDITIQKSMQTQLEQALRLESVGQLAAGVAHEINTPMQYIGDNIRYVSTSLQKLDPLFDCMQLLVNPDVTVEQINKAREQILPTYQPSKVKLSLQQIPEALNDSIEGVSTVSRIVAAMKEFSHPGDTSKSQVCINHILESTITVARNEWRYVADLETDFDETPILLDAMPGELNQAFLNIIVNASHAIADRVEATDYEKGLIRIRTCTADDRVLVSIQDNGGGIPEHVRQKVFEPFFTTKEVGKGTGQGLAIAYSVIVQKHGGDLFFNVQEGVGTTFNISLPKYAEVADQDSN